MVGASAPASADVPTFSCGVTITCQLKAYLNEVVGDIQDPSVLSVKHVNGVSFVSGAAGHTTGAFGCYGASPDAIGVEIHSCTSGSDRANNVSVVGPAAATAAPHTDLENGILLRSVCYEIEMFWRRGGSTVYTGCSTAVQIIKFA